jgi:hypothetical protein
VGLSTHDYPYRLLIFWIWNTCLLWFLSKLTRLLKLSLDKNLTVIYITHLIIILKITLIFFFKKKRKKKESFFEYNSATPAADLESDGHFNRERVWISAPRYGIYITYCERQRIFVQKGVHPIGSSTRIYL